MEMNIIEKTLIECLHVLFTPKSMADMQTLDETDWGLLVDLASELGVASLLYHRLNQHGILDRVPESQRKNLFACYGMQTRRNMVISHQCNKICGLLQQAEIPVLLLKGIHLAHTIYEKPGLRQMGDLDILVPQNRVADAAAIVLSLGYEPDGGRMVDTDTAMSVMEHHLTRLKKEGSIDIEIHWTIGRRAYNSKFDIDEFWNRAVKLDIFTPPVQVLSVEDTILYLCEHASFSHRFEFGLKPFCDLAQIIYHYGDGVDWDQIGKHAIRWGWTRGVYLALRIAKDLLDAAVPMSLLLTIEPSDINPDVLETAIRQIFANPESGKPVSENMAQLWQEPGFYRKLSRFFKAVFIPKKLISVQYGISLYSPFLSGYYLVRAIDLLVRYGSITRKMFQGDADILSMTDRKDMLRKWLSAENG